MRRGSAIAACLVAVHLALVLHAASRHSAVFDEIVYPTSGYAYWTTGDYRMNPEHPPFLKLWTALPWLASGLDATRLPGWEIGDEWGWGQAFLYGAGRRGEILFGARLMVALLSGALAVAIYLVARRMAGQVGGVVALSLYAFDPLAIAHAGFATTDLGGAAFYFLAVIAMERGVALGRRRWLLGSGVLTGLALASKFSTVPILLVLAAYAIFSLGARQPALGVRVTRAAVIVAVAVAVLIACYGPAGPGLYARGLGMLAFHGEVGHPAYAFGRYGSEGWWWYFPAAWAVKTPIPVLVGSALGAVTVLRGWKAHRSSTFTLLVPPLLVVVPALQSSLNLGVRHLLPCTPFLAVAAGVAAEAFWRERRWARALVVAGLLWLAVGTLWTHPDEMAYANEAAGGPSTLWKRLADSNVDWGQSLPALAEEVSKHPLRRLYLSYFGTADPAAHGLAYTWAPGMRMIEARLESGPDPDGKEWLAVSVTNLLSVYTTGHDAYAWLVNRPFSAFPGYSIALFDITGDALAHRRLGETALRFGDAATAILALTRSIEIDPQDASARALLSRAQALARGADPGAYP